MDNDTNDSDTHKRKRDKEEPSSSSLSASGSASAVAVSVDDLLHPNFEELARQHPTTFGRAWRAVESSRQAAIDEYTATHTRNQYLAQNPKRKPHLPHSVTALETYVTPAFSLHLTRALLHQHWQLSLPALPTDLHLCPPVPNRYFLVHWVLQTLMPRLCLDEYFEQKSTTTTTIRSQFNTIITGLDIGTGASAIYALLACASCSTCHMYATDIDAQAVEYAAQNVRANQLQNRIATLVISPSTMQQQQQQQQSSHFDDKKFAGPYRRSLTPIRDKNPAAVPTCLDFCIVNPPFDDVNNADSVSSTRRRRDGRKRTPLTQTEGWYPGGEVGFMRDIFVDQLSLFILQHEQQRQHSNPGWTACMCGKKTSWVTVTHALQAILGISHVDTTQFGPGTQVRWFVAWTWQPSAMHSPLAARWNWQFEVSSDNNVTVWSDIYKRLADFCTYKHEWNLHLHVGANSFQLLEQPNAIRWHDEDAPAHSNWLPKPVQTILAGWDAVARAKALLPIQGHFVIDIINVTEKQELPITVQCQAYAHSLYGKRRVAQIQNVLAGEIARTSRKWRRKLKQQQQGGACPNHKEDMAMDES